MKKFTKKDILHQDILDAEREIDLWRTWVILNCEEIEPIDIGILKTKVHLFLEEMERIG